MTKKESLISDIDFVKEVEELKLKQKILIESLKKKNSNEQNKLFLEINSKLDFLVNIFKETNKIDNEEVQEETKQFEEIISKIDEVKKDFELKFNSIEKTLETMNKKSLTNNNQLKNLNNNNQNISNNNQENNNKDNNQISNETQIEPPVPQFESKIEDLNQTKKKKKWF